MFTSRCGFLSRLNEILKGNDLCAKKDRARNVGRTINLSRYLPVELNKVIDSVLQRNAFFAHPENLLLAMVTDKRIDVRELGLRRILKARLQGIFGIRQFTVSSLNYDSSDYIEMIDWQSTNITEPPMVVEVSDAAIIELVKSGDGLVIDFRRFPCLTKAVEHCVKLVTQASAAVCGQTARDGFIRSRQDSRRIMSSFDIKAEYTLINWYVEGSTEQCNT